MMGRFIAEGLALGCDKRVSKRRGVFFSALAAICVSVAAPSAQSAPPNIVVILADDLGYGDVSFDGSLTDYTTPNIDSIAANGVRITNGYATHPVCSPSRAGLITGRYQQRFGYENNSDIDSTNPRLGLPMNEKLLSDILKPAGYVCGAIGKWHLGFAPNFHATNRGFDEFFGFLGAQSTYYNANVLRGEAPLTETSYLTDAFTREGVSFINRHATQPFFLYLAYSAPHGPYDQPPDTYVSRVSNISDAKRQTYAAMIVAMDDGVGQVLQALQTNNLLNNTLIIFLSDNGATDDSFTRNNPLRGYKLDMLEGGIRVPFALQWNGHLPANTVYDQPISSLDIAPTLAAAAGVSLPTDRVYDGLNILPYLTGQQTAPQRTLFWHWFGLGTNGPPGSMDTIWAVRNGPLKLVTERATTEQPPALYDLPNDIGESRNLAASQPADVASLQNSYNQWVSTNLIPPVWQFNTDFPKSLILAGDWNNFQSSGSMPAPWQLTSITAPGVGGTPDGFNWFSNTIHVAATGGDTTAGTHSFALVGNSNYSTQWGGGTINIDNATSVPFFSGGALGPTSSISLQNGFYYSFRIIDPVVDNWNNQIVGVPLKIAMMKTSAPPISVSRSGQTPASPTANDPIVISILASQAKAPEERIFLRWSTDFYITSHLVAATGSGVNYSATIPAQPAGTAVQYGVVTSTVDLSPLVASGAIDALTLATTDTFKVVSTAATAGTPPAITTQPVNKTVTEGQTAKFSVTATGTTPRSYQWKKNGTIITGATSVSYTTPATTLADDGSLFAVVVSNVAGSVTSNNATLTVNAATPPAITTQPANRSVTEGLTATFNVTATGAIPLAYQWMKNGADITGATKRSYTTPATTQADNGAVFAVTVSNSLGSVTSNNATLTVKPPPTPPVITTQPASKTVTAGQTAKFTVVATGGSLHYQWMKNGANITGATTASYTTPPTTVSDNGSLFAVTVSNSGGSVTSNNATLTITAAP